MDMWIKRWMMDGWMKIIFICAVLSISYAHELHLELLKATESFTSLFFSLTPD